MTETTPTTVFRRRRTSGSRPQARTASLAGPVLEAPGQEALIGPAHAGTLLPPEQHAAGAAPPDTARASGRADEGLRWEELEPTGFYARYGKRAFNLALLLLVAPFALALSLPIALINWLQFGRLDQVLYRQPRVGRRGRTFSIYKFRTMREAYEDDFDSWSRGQDRLRVTRFGRLLRNTHLDELPQLLNILRGEMDFIGPRPEMVEIDQWACSHVPGFRKRNALVPGITGYAQITQGYTGKDDAAYAEKLAGDELYRRHLSFGLDLLILLRTGVWMLRGRGWRFNPARAVVQRASRDAEQAEGLSETSAA